MGTTAAVAMLIKREKELAAHFRAAGATSPATAKSFDELRLESNLHVRRLRSRGVLREAASGRFFLDVPEWDAREKFRKRMLVAVVLMGIATGYLLTSWMALRGGA